MRRFSIGAAGVALALGLSGCGSSRQTGGSANSSGGGVRKVPFTLTKAGCDPAHLELPAGATTFDVKNGGADAVSEMELAQGGRIVGEIENLTPGLSGSFTVTLKPGTYETTCPNEAPMFVKGRFGVAGRPVMGHSGEGELL